MVKLNKPALFLVTITRAIQPPCATWDHVLCRSIAQTKINRLQQFLICSMTLRDLWVIWQKRAKKWTWRGPALLQSLQGETSFARTGAYCVIIIFHYFFMGWGYLFSFSLCLPLFWMSSGLKTCTCTPPQPGYWAWCLEGIKENLPAFLWHCNKHTRSFGSAGWGLICLLILLISSL